MNIKSLHIINIIVLITVQLLSLECNSATIYLCKSYSGGTFWSSGKCSNQNALIDRIISVPDNMPFEEQVKMGEANRANANTINQGNISYSNQSQQQTTQNKQSLCNSIAEQILNLDAEARKANSSYVQDSIAEQKRQLRDNQYRSNCNLYKK